MKRLTTRLPDGRAFPVKCVEHPDEYKQDGTDLVERLCEYEDEEEQGKLLHLPCKIGDHIYEVFYTNIVRRQVVGFRWNADSIYFIDSYGISICVGNVGRTVFYTQEEAEAKLKELEADDGLTDN